MKILSRPRLKIFYNEFIFVISYSRNYFIIRHSILLYIINILLRKRLHLFLT